MVQTRRKTNATDTHESDAVGINDLEMDTLVLIMGTVMDGAARETRSSAGEFRYEQPPQSKREESAAKLRALSSNYSSVCKSFQHAVSEVVHDGARAVVAPHMLRDIKQGVRALDLHRLAPVYMQEAKGRIGFFQYFCEDEDTVITKDMIHYFCSTMPDSLADKLEDTDAASPFENEDEFVWHVTEAYKKFLVVKCVETLVVRRVATGELDPTAPDVEMWTTRCQPTRIIDMMWHAHMLSPKLYQLHCLELAGETIDHDAGYVMDDTDTKSAFGMNAKIDALFKHEIENEILAMVRPPSAMSIFMTKECAAIQKADPTLKYGDAYLEATRNWAAMDAEEKAAYEPEAANKVLVLPAGLTASVAQLGTSDSGKAVCKLISTSLIMWQISLVDGLDDEGFDDAECG
jgi:hypothetical protein